MQISTDEHSYMVTFSFLSSHEQFECQSRGHGFKLQVGHSYTRGFLQFHFLDFKSDTSELSTGS